MTFEIISSSTVHYRNNIIHASFHIKDLFFYIRRSQFVFPVVFIWYLCPYNVKHCRCSTVCRGSFTSCVSFIVLGFVIRVLLLLVVFSQCLIIENTVTDEASARIIREGSTSVALRFNILFSLFFFFKVVAGKSEIIFGYTNQNAVFFIK